MRYNDRITITNTVPPDDELYGSPKKDEKSYPCLTIPITNTQELSVYGLVSKMAYEIHLKNPVPLADKVKLNGIEYTVNKTFVNRKSTIFIVSGGA